MADDNELSNFLNNTGEDVQADEQTAEPSPEPTLEPQDDPQPEPNPEPDVKKGEADAEPPAAQEVEKNVPLAALQDERAKRQELEQKLAQMQNGAGQEAPDPVTDPEGAYKALQAQTSAQNLETRIDLSREFAMKQHDDYEEIEKLFAEKAGEDPHYWRQVASSKNPAQTAYELGQRFKFEAEMGGDPAAYKAKLIEEGRKQVLAEQAAASEKAGKDKLAASLPSDLSGPSIPSGQATEWQGPESLDKILPGN